jgi:FAD/FMN-containing dehydrogenase/Fe-S oxidoreductase
MSQSPINIPSSVFAELLQTFEGELYYNNSILHKAQRLLYSTDASVYQEKPIAVAVPKSVEDIQKLINFADKQAITLIPRAAGTSLAGQVVGSGLVVDISKYFTKIIEVSPQEKWVRVQPGVIRDDLNAYLKNFGLMFGPETSTANRAMIGGMVGNNSCGLHSPVWGTTRDHVLEMKVLLSDGQEVTLKANDDILKAPSDGLLGKIEGFLTETLQSFVNQRNIKAHFPNKNVTRRNTGYALDALLDTQPFGGDESFNLCKLIAGSEGTLCFITEIKLNLLPLPPAHVGLVCVHCNSIEDSLKANLIAMRHGAWASELVDKYILDFTIGHPEYHKNRFFIEGDPAAILIVELAANSADELDEKTSGLINELKNNELGYAFPVITGAEMKLVWDVRKGGLGLLRNLPGDTQPVNLIEDCAVAIDDLPAYVADLEQLLARYNTRASYYAHAGAGELHVEPLINLKTKAGQELFRTILAETAIIVKKYGGSLSGEHGDGRLRGEFIPFMVGQENYELFRKIKQVFDPKGIFNAGKITDTPPMNQFLRYEADQKPPKSQTVFDFSKQESFLRLAEKCSGSGDCRKTEITGGTMCPSFMATRSERDTTRARANMLRHFLTEQTGEKIKQSTHSKETKEILDLCLSCKGCKSECPSGVDIAKMKAEFMQHYYDKNGVPLRSWLIGNFPKLNRIAANFPKLNNWLFSNKFTSNLFKKIVGFAPERSVPLLGEQTFRQWYKSQTSTAKKREKRSTHYAPVEIGKRRHNRKVYLFVDEFTNFNDVDLGIKAYQLLTRLGYEVHLPRHIESGRTYLSKGLVREARQVAIRNVKLLSEAIKDNSPIIGIEPSAILTLRDEYLELVPDVLHARAEQIAENTYLFEEFFAQEIDKKFIQKKDFIQEKRLVKLHGHCHQKAMSSMVPVKKMLSLPDNYEVQLIPSGCCGMAGSFGYETEHYELSMKVGELVLFPTVRQTPDDTIIAASGTSCRHQIKDGTGRVAKHPIEILWEALA